MEEKIKDQDKIFSLIQKEYERQKKEIGLIASENFVSNEVASITGSILTNKYAEGYPKDRYYGGCKVVDEIEELAIERACELFDCTYANVQPHSGSQANMAVYGAFLKPGDKILGLKLDHGGHLTHGHFASFSGSFYKSCFYEVDKSTGLLDYDAIRLIAKKEKPQMIIAGASSYPRQIDFQKFRSIADEVGAWLLADIAHIAGLIAANQHPHCFPYAHVATSTTHKTLRGPRGGLILAHNLTKDEQKKLNNSVFPGIQGGPLMHIIAAKARCFFEARDKSFARYIQNTLNNMQTLCAIFESRGLKMASGGSDNHLVLLDLSHMNKTGLEVAENLLKTQIVVNKNAIPFDPLSPKITSGIRLGTAAITTRGMRKAEVAKIGHWISDVIYAKITPEELLPEVNALTKQFPLFWKEDNAS